MYCTLFDMTKGLTVDKFNKKVRIASNELLRDKIEAYEANKIEADTSQKVLKCVNVTDGSTLPEDYVSRAFNLGFETKTIKKEGKRGIEYKTEDVTDAGYTYKQAVLYNWCKSTAKNEFGYRYFTIIKNIINLAPEGNASLYYWACVSPGSIKEVFETINGEKCRTGYAIDECTQWSKLDLIDLFAKLKRLCGIMGKDQFLVQEGLNTD